MGNELAKKYDMPKTHSASGGHECLWKIYQATAKATGEQVSVFVLDIDEASKGLSSKAEKEQLLDIFRRDMRALKEMSHPNVLKIHEVMEESKKLMAFVSERVLCSMSNALHRFKNLPPTAVSSELAEYRLTEMELGRGMGHLCDALQYSHYVARRLHLNISPDSIFINPQGVWKLAGFGMCISLSANEVGPQMQTLCPYYQQGGPPRRAGQYRLEPQLAYTPPEITQAGTSRIGYSADAFSLACVVHEAFQMPHLVGIADVAKPLIELPDHATTQEQLAALQRLHPINMRRIPDSVKDPLERMLALEPAHRPEAIALTQASFFHSGPVSTLRDLDMLASKDPAGQATFLSSLADKLPLFTTRLQRTTVLPPVLAAANANPALWLYAIPLVIKVSEVLSRDEFATTVQEGLKAAYSLRPPNPQVMYMLGQQTPLLLERAQHSFFIEHVYPMLLLGLESGVPQLQDQVVKQLGDEKMGQAVGHKRLLEDVLPRLGHILVQTTHVSVRVNALVCLSKTHRYYGKQVLVDAILPTLKVCLDKDQTPAVVMCVLGCYDVILKELEPQYICTHVLPVLAPMVYLRTLTSAQFEKLSSRVSAMLQRAIEFRRTEISSKTGTTAAASEHDGSVSPVSFMTSGNTNPASLSTAMVNAPGTSTSASGSTSAPADPMADWAWLKPLAASAASSATNLLANATNTLTTTVNGVVAKASSSASSSSSSSTYPNLDSGSGVRYDASSNPYQLPGTEFSLSKPPAPAPAPAPIDLSAYKPTTKPSYAGIGGGDSGSGPMTPSSLESGSTGRTKKFERQKSNPTVPPLMPVTAPVQAPAPASSFDLDFMAGTNTLPAPRQPSSSSLTKLGMPPLPPSDGTNMFTGLSPPRQATSSRPGFTRTAPVPAPSPALSSTNLAASLGPLQPIQASSPARTQPPNAYGNAGLQGPPTQPPQFMAPLQPIYATPQPVQPQQQPSAYNYGQPAQAPSFGGASGMDRMSAFDNLNSAFGDVLPQAAVPQQQQQPYGTGGMAMGGSQQPGYGMPMQQQQYQQQSYQQQPYQQQPYQQQPYQQQPQQPQQQQQAQQYGASGFDFMR